MAMAIKMTPSQFGSRDKKDVFSSEGCSGHIFCGETLVACKSGLDGRLSGIENLAPLFETLEVGQRLPKLCLRWNIFEI